MSLGLGSKDTNPPTRDTQKGRLWGGSTNGRANACRRRLQRRVRSGQSRPAPCQVETCLATSAVFANISASVISSSLPSPWGAPGHLDRPCRSRPDPSLDFDFCLSTSISVLTTSTYVVAWPQISCWEGGHGTRQTSPQPIGFRFRFIPRKVPGLSAHWRAFPAWWLSGWR